MDLTPTSSISMWKVRMVYDQKGKPRGASSGRFVTCDSLYVAPNSKLCPHGTTRICIH